METIVYKLINPTKVGWLTGGFFVYQECAYKYLRQGSFLDMQPYQFNILSFWSV